MISHNKWGRHCSVRTFKCPRELWPKRSWINDSKSHIMPPCCRDHLIEVQHYIHDLFEEHGIEYWMDFGTLLGAVRTGENVEFDDDGDMGIFGKDEKRIISLKKRAAADGFCINPQWHMDRMNGKGRLQKEQDLIRFSRSENNDIYVDLFPWRSIKKGQGGTWNQGTYNDGLLWNKFGLNMPKAYPDWFTKQKSNNHRHFYGEFFSRVKLHGKEMLAPRDPEAFLEMRFGSDWRIPQNKKVHHESALDCHYRMFSYARRKGWKGKNHPMYGGGNGGNHHLGGTINDARPCPIGGTK